MPTDEFIDHALGFQVAWDADVFEAVTDGTDARLRWAIGALFGESPAAALLLVPRTPAAASPPLAPPFILLGTNGRAAPPRALSDWDWREGTKRYAARAMDRFAVPTIGVSHYYWHGFPMLQLDLDVTTTDAPVSPLGRSVAYLFTPQQTFTLFSDLMGVADEDLARAVSDFYTSFHLVPRDREGRRGQAHEMVRMPFIVHQGDLEGFRLP